MPHPGPSSHLPTLLPVAAVVDTDPRSQAQRPPREDDIANLAARFASIRIEAQAP
jgi:hypothetical protein